MVELYLLPGEERLEERRKGNNAAIPKANLVRPGAGGFSTRNPFRAESWVFKVSAEKALDIGVELGALNALK